MKEYEGVYAVCWESDNGRHDIWSIHRDFDNAEAEAEKCEDYFRMVHPDMKVTAFISGEYLED